MAAWPLAANPMFAPKPDLKNRAPVKVDLCAWAAWALVTHLPEVVLAPKGQHALGGQEAQPDGLSLLVNGQALET